MDCIVTGIIVGAAAGTVMAIGYVLVELAVEHYNRRGE